MRYVPVIVIPFEDRNIVLTGFMGTGKSTVGRRLARRLGFSWVDTDHLIEERHGPIPEIFARAGEAVFRGVERNIAIELAARTRHVFSTGGRMLLDPDNIRAFSVSGRIFCLSADPEILVTRLLRSPTQRPLLAGPDPESDIRSLLVERQAGYGRFPTITTDEGPPDLVAERLAQIILDPTETPTGRRGVAVIGDAPAGLAGPIVVLTDDIVGTLYGPLLGPVDLVATSPDDLPGNASVIILGGSSVTDHVADRMRGSVVVPTTEAAMNRDYPTAMRVVADLATLGTAP